MIEGRNTHVTTFRGGQAMTRWIRQGLVAASLAMTPITGAGAADYLGAAAPASAPPEVSYLRIGPGNDYDVIATIRPGTAPRVRFCEYHGRWCYGSYGRWDGWFYGGPNTWDHWGWSYLFGS